MRIKVTEERECCQPQDLRPLHGCEMVNFNIPKVKFCIHCGRRHRYESFMDAAGSRDYHYMPELEAKE